MKHVNFGKTNHKRMITALLLLQAVCILFLVSQNYGSHFTSAGVLNVSMASTVLRENNHRYTITMENAVATNGAVKGATPALNLKQEARGMMTGCTLTDIKKKPGVVLLSTTNTGFLDLTLNMLESIKRAGLCLNTTVVAEDEYSYNYLRNRSLDDQTFRVQKTHFGVTYSEKLMVFSQKYNELVNKRQHYILELLEQGFDVLFSDSDTFWFRDPFWYFQGDFDMSFVDERSPYPTRLPTKSIHCAGLGYFKPSPRTKLFLRRWIEEMNKPGKIPGDQPILNRLLHEDQPVRMAVKPLPVAHFPHALVYYKPEWRQENNHTIIMHNVGIRGHDKKVESFKANGMWVLD